MNHQKHFPVNWLIACVLLCGASLAYALPNDDKPFILPPLPAGKAMIYVYSSGYLGKWIVPPMVILDGREQDSMPQSVYLPLQVEPGTHTVQVQERRLLRDNSRYDLTLQTEAGKYYYVVWRGEEGETRKMKNSTVIIPVITLRQETDEATALQRLDDLRTPQQLDEMMK